MPIVAIVVSLVSVSLVALLVHAARKPDTMIVTRSTEIAAEPASVFPQLVDFRRWEIWSPYEKKDPAMKRTHSGAASGVGARYAWDGNRDIGAGSMEIVEARPGEKVVLALEFLRPFEASNVATFTVDDLGGRSRVTWSMRCTANFPSKVVGTFLDLDAMIGKDFEDGLRTLKSITEA